MPPLDLDFLHRFVDREEELAAIESAWAAACQGKPQFVLLLGDSGLGKTRLVHKFYRTLHRQTAQTSGAHYWPAELDTSPRTLRINPDPPSGGHSLNELPWFWLGLRWRQPDGINAGPHRPCALLDGEVQSVLAAHMDVLLRQRQRQADAQEAAKVTGDKAASDWLPYALGPYALAYQIPKTLFDLWRSTRPWRQSLAAADTADLAAELAGKQVEAEEVVRDFLTALLDSSSVHAPTVPVILVLDDAQWADPITLGFVRDLFLEARRAGWPLLVLATCWETEWKERAEESWALPASGVDPEHLNMMLAQIESNAGGQPAALDQSSASVRRLELRRFAQPTILAPLIDGIFPGFTQPVRDYLYEVSNGNPKVLAELLIDIQQTAEDHWFNAQKRPPDLTPEGFDEVRRLQVENVKMFRTRAARLANQEPTLHRFLAIASLQGPHFFSELAAETCRRLEPELVIDTPGLISLAIAPRNLISHLSANAQFAEFKERAAWENLRASCRARWPQAEMIQRTVLGEWLAEGRLARNPAAPELLSLYLSQLRDTGSSATMLLPVLGQLMVTLQERSRYREAIRAALEILEAAGSTGWEVVLACLSTEGKLALARCLLDAHRYSVVLELAARFQPASGLEAEQGARWLQLKARALDGLEQFAAAAAAWAEAIAQTPAASAAENRFLIRLHLGLAASQHRLHGWRHAYWSYRNALRILTDGTNELPETPAHLRLGGWIFFGIAEAFYDAGRLNRAVVAIHRAEKAYERWLEITGPEPQLLEEFSRCLSRRGDWLMRGIGGEPGEAVPILERALDLRLVLARRVGETKEVLAQLAAGRSLLAGALELSGDGSRQLELVERAVTLRREVLQGGDEDPSALRQLTLTLVRRGDILRAINPEAAEVDYLDAIQIRDKLVAAAGNRRDHQHRKDVRNALYAWRKLGELRVAENNIEGASEPLFYAWRLSCWLRRRFDPEATDLRNAYICLEQLALLAQRKENASRARRRFIAALAVVARLNYRFGLGRAALSDRTRFHDAVALLSLGGTEPTFPQ